LYRIAVPLNRVVITLSTKPRLWYYYSNRKNP